MRTSEAVNRLKELGYHIQRGSGDDYRYIKIYGDIINILISGFTHTNIYLIYAQNSQVTFRRLRPAIHALYKEVVKHKLGI